MFRLSIIRRIIKDLIYLRVLRKAHAQIFLAEYGGLKYRDTDLNSLLEEERRLIMEKYAVEIDPSKVEQEKKASEGAKAKKPDPNTNVPIDPELGTEPFEKKPDGE